MTCKDCRKLIIKDSYNELSFKDKMKMHKHIKKCEYCLSELFKFNRLAKLVSDLPELQPSPFFENSLRIKLIRSKAYTESKQWFRSKKLAFAGVISFVFVMIFGLYLYRQNYEKEGMQALGNVESEIIKYNSILEGNKHFVMPSIGFYENLETDNYNGRKNYILTSVDISDGSNYVLDKIIVYQKDR